MFYKMIENKCTQWYESERCTVKNLIEYIEKKGQMRDVQIEAIKVYLFQNPAAAHYLNMHGKRPIRGCIEISGCCM